MEFKRSERSGEMELSSSESSIMEISFDMVAMGDRTVESSKLCWGL